jgi:hypothetical protein
LIKVCYNYYSKRKGVGLMQKWAIKNKYGQVMIVSSFRGMALEVIIRLLNQDFVAAKGNESLKIEISEMLENTMKSFLKPSKIFGCKYYTAEEIEEMEL